MVKAIFPVSVLIGKVGKPFEYPESFLAMLAFVHAYLLPYRQLEGFTRALTRHVDELDAPDYTSIAWRVARMQVAIDPSIKEEDDIVIAADSSCITETTLELCHSKLREEVSISKKFA